MVEQSTYDEIIFIPYFFQHLPHDLLPVRMIDQFNFGTDKVEVRWNRRKDAVSGFLKSCLLLSPSPMRHS
jgi:hypothetical protein